MDSSSATHFALGNAGALCCFDTSTFSSLSSPLRAVPTEPGGGSGGGGTSCGEPGPFAEAAVCCAVDDGVWKVAARARGCGTDAGEEGVLSVAEAFRAAVTSPGGPANGDEAPCAATEGRRGAGTGRTGAETDSEADEDAMSPAGKMGLAQERGNSPAAPVCRLTPGNG